MQTHCPAPAIPTQPNSPPLCPNTPLRHAHTTSPLSLCTTSARGNNHMQSRLTNNEEEPPNPIQMTKKRNIVTIKVVMMDPNAKSKKSCVDNLSSNMIDGGASSMQKQSDTKTQRWSSVACPFQSHNLCTDYCYLFFTSTSLFARSSS